jgi:hypothetical protein
MFMIVKLILEVPTRQSPHGAFGTSTEITIMAMFARERKNVAPEVAQALACGCWWGQDRSSLDKNPHAKACATRISPARLYGVRYNRKLKG